MYCRFSLIADSTSVLQDPETYIHRSGRTGRAGSTGVSVTLVDRKKEGLIPYIQKKAGVNFERIGAPQPAQMAQIAGMPASQCITSCKSVPSSSNQRVAALALARRDLPAHCASRVSLLPAALAPLRPLQTGVPHEACDGQGSGRWRR